MPISFAINLRFEMYYYQVVAANADDSAGGEIMKLTTLACPPSLTPPSPIPALSELAKIIMMLLMIATVGFYGWRMKQR